MTSIALTRRASDRIRSVLDGAGGQTRFGLRVSVESFGWANRYKLSLAPAPGPDEIVVKLVDVDVYKTPRPRCSG